MCHHGSLYDSPTGAHINACYDSESQVESAATGKAIPLREMVRACEGVKDFEKLITCRDQRSLKAMLDALLEFGSMERLAGTQREPLQILVMWWMAARALMKRIAQRDPICINEVEPALWVGVG